MEENKLEVPALMTPILMEVKINTEVAKNGLSIAVLQDRALKIVKNEDNLLAMATFLKDLDKGRDMATEIHKREKKPFADGAKNCDEGKKLVFEQFDRLESMVKPDYDKLLAGVDARKREAEKKEAQDKAIKKGIEETAAAFAKKIVTAATPRELSDVERLINLQKSPSMAKKYGEFHALAMKRYDEMLLPIIKSQKTRFQKLTALHGELEEAVSDRESEEVGKLQGKIEVVSQEVRQIQAVAEDMLLTQEFFPVVEAEEVLPEIRTKRTDISYELVDAAVALKKVPHLLTIDLNNKELKKVAAEMKKNGAFKGKDFVIVDGIKYIVTRQREAL